MKSFARKFYVLSLTATYAACGNGSGGEGTSAVSVDDPRIASNYTVFQLDPLPGHFRSTAHDINDDGQIVGWSGDLSQKAVLWTIDEAGATWGRCLAEPSVLLTELTILGKSLA